MALILSLGTTPVAARDLLESGTVAPRAALEEAGEGANAERREKLHTGGIGWDISFPQCGSPFPRGGDFRIVGVNGGRAFSANPCLGKGDDPSELRWAGMRAWLYMNTGNPRPSQTERWPVGQTWPRVCRAAFPNSPGCSFNYGWNFARDAYRTAVQAYISLGWAEPGAKKTPVENRWWLDVETANSWRENTSRNVSALRGAVAYLERVGVRSIGFYSAPHMWTNITGGTRTFAGYPNWVAGASTLNGAKHRCAGSGFTGGGVWLTQFFKSGFDANYAC
jgi:hypothetical protein